MAHGLAFFRAQELIDKANGALRLVDETLDGADEGAGVDGIREALRIIFENQIKIAETLDLIKTEFDKFEEGLGRIL